MAGDPFSVRLHVEPREPIEPPRLLIEVRDASGALLSRAERGLGELGWDGQSETAIRFDVDELPLVEGRFQLNVALTNEDHSRRYHVVEKAAEFTSHPQGGATGIFVLEGDWTLDRESTVVETETA